MRADRLLSLLLLLQARGRTPASELARELEVSVRTIYRDITALSSAGVPVLATSGPQGGCELLQGYQAAARRLIAASTGLAGPGQVHLDMPRWFSDAEPVPDLPTLAQAVRERRQAGFTYRGAERTAGALGLVNKAGIWYFVAVMRERVTVFRAGRITGTRLLPGPAVRPDGFDLAEFWEQWSAEFMTSRPRTEVLVRASPAAFTAFPESFGDAVRSALAAASPPGADGWREVTLSFENAVAAVHRLAGFGAQIEVLRPAEVRDLLVSTAQEIVDRYRL